MDAAFSIGTFAYCVVIFVVCVERLRITTGQTDWALRWSIAMLAVTSLAWGSKPLLWPDSPALFLRFAMAFSIAFYLLAVAPAWRHGPPRIMHRDGERRTGKERRTGGRRGHESTA